MPEANSPLENPSWVARKRYSEMTGIPESTIRGWQARNLTRGVHFQVHGRTTLINQEEINKWLTELGQNPSHPSTNSVSGSVSSTIRNRTPKSSRAITIPKLTSKRQLQRGTE